MCLCELSWKRGQTWNKTIQKNFPDTPQDQAQLCILVLWHSIWCPEPNWAMLETLKLKLVLYTFHRPFPIIELIGTTFLQVFNSPIGPENLNKVPMLRLAWQFAPRNFIQAIPTAVHSGQTWWPLALTCCDVASNLIKECMWKTILSKPLWFSYVLTLLRICTDTTMAGKVWCNYL